jgi:hypothetical protein
MAEELPLVAAPNSASPNREFIVHQGSGVLIKKSPILQKTDKPRDTLRPTTPGIILLQDRHVAGPLISLELPLGRAKCISLGSCGAPVETGARSPDSRFFLVSHFNRR